MRYISTRGQAPVLGFEEAMLTGLARDGGLYLPESIPQMSADDIRALEGVSYEEAAFRVMWPYLGGAFTEDEFRGIIARAYAGFGHAARAPLKQLAPGHFLLELFHGPTLAFKDFAMQLIGQMFEASLKRSGRRVCIVGATSGDTGSAAIEAFRGLEAVDVFILYPHGRVSEVQRRQMTTPVEANVHALAIDGHFDDAQARVKDMFNDFAFRDEVRLAGVNSINWARVLAQVVYYFTAAVSLGAPDRKVSFTVPTGNFGDSFRGVYRAPDGAADREAGGGDQPQRHPAPLPEHGHLSPRRGGPDDQPVDGYPGVLEFRAGALLCLWAGRARGGAGDGGAEGGRIHREPGRVAGPARGV